MKKTKNITDMDRTSILLLVQTAYRSGLSNIELEFDKPFAFYHRTGEYVDIEELIDFCIVRFKGTIKKNVSKNKIILNFKNDKPSNFGTLLLELFKETEKVSELFLHCMENKRSEEFNAIEQMHNHIASKSSYILRCLNLQGYKDDNKNILLSNIIFNLELLIDIFKNISREWRQSFKPISQNSLLIIQMVNNSIKMWTVLFFKVDRKLINNLDKNRILIRKELYRNINNFNSWEVFLLSSMIFLLEILLNMTEMRFGMENG